MNIPHAVLAAASCLAALPAPEPVPDAADTMYLTDEPGNVGEQRDPALCRGAAHDLPAGQFGLVFMGDAQVQLPFGDGLRCVGAGSAGIYRFPARATGSGSFQEGPIVGFSRANFPPAGQIGAGSTWHFQAWYRDPGGPCGSGFNASNALRATFVP